MKETHGVSLYPFQREISDKLLRAVLYPKKYKNRKIRAKVSRQSGKTEGIVGTAEFLLIFHRSITGRRIRIGIFAPQREQAKTDFDRLKERLAEASTKGFGNVDTAESNATTLQLKDKSYCYIFPLTETSSPESKTLDLIIYEEANGIKDIHKKRKSDPMGSSTNATEIAVGVGNYAKNFFQRDCQQGGDNVIVADALRVIREKREAFNQDGQEWHLAYEQFVEGKKEEWGEDDDAYRTQYLVQDVLGVGQFITDDDFNKLVVPGTDDHTGHRLVAGIDTAKSPDDTVCTLKCLDCKRIAGWLELHGDNYQDQFDAIRSYLEAKKTVVALAIDSTGQADFMPDLFVRNTQWSVEGVNIFRVKFNLSSKDQLYKNLITVVRNKATTVPEIHPSKFKEQALDLQKEYKGEYLSVHHPDDQNAHDDYPDSWALAEWAAHKVAEHGEAKISFI